MLDIAISSTTILLQFCTISIHFIIQFICETRTRFEHHNFHIFNFKNTMSPTFHYSLYTTSLTDHEWSIAMVPIVSVSLSLCPYPTHRHAHLFPRPIRHWDAAMANWDTVATGPTMLKQLKMTVPTIEMHYFRRPLIMELMLWLMTLLVGWDWLLTLLVWPVLCFGEIVDGGPVM